MAESRLVQLPVFNQIFAESFTMIKVNLLQNSIERTGVEAVETAISSQSTRQTLLALIALGACIIACVGRYILVNRENARVKEELVVEQKTNAMFTDLSRQVKELEAKNKQVEARINAIQQLRSEQTGPLRLLQMIDARLPVDSTFRLSSIKQEKSTDKSSPSPGISIQGYSPSEAKVTEFAKNLEFSDGLFSAFVIETQVRDNPETQKDDKNLQKSSGAVIEFTIRCAYNPQAILTGSAVASQAEADKNTRVNPAAGNGSTATPSAK